MSNPCFECGERQECNKPCENLIEWVRKGCPGLEVKKEKKK